MARTGWFETVAEAQRRARRRLPPSVYSALLAGSERGISYDDNTAALGELGFAPHVADLSASRDQGTRVMGQHISLPVLISPTGSRRSTRTARWRWRGRRPRAARRWG
jgi:isopentenyl diphosphate isomerase/L-lactate dehydrogenase-like FMN-dependent dehydrogenase